VHGGRVNGHQRDFALRTEPADLPGLALALGLGLVFSPARAEPPGAGAAKADVRPATAPALRFAATLAAVAARPAFMEAPPLGMVPVSRLTAFSMPDFADHNDPQGQLRALRHLRVLRLWDDRHLSVFVGLNREGLPGLHFQRRDPSDLPPSAPGTISSDLPLLRALLPRMP
jgi:hypothetical protein